MFFKKKKIRNFNVWIHREEMDHKDERGVIHQKYMCPKCGFIHDCIDGHMSQYQYCPQCGLFLGEGMI